MIDVPEHLAHLRRDRRGLPVPYVNRWGEEDQDRVSITFDRHVNGPAVSYDDADQPVPDFTAQHFDRQRECVLTGLCQVCARHVPWSRRFLVLAELSVQVITLQGRRVAVVTEPWLCQRCATYAVEVCPALIRRRRDERLTLVPVTSQRDVTLTYSVGYLDGRLEEESRRLQPAMWAKVCIGGAP